MLSLISEVKAVPYSITDTSMEVPLQHHGHYQKEPPGYNEYSSTQYFGRQTWTSPILGELLISCIRTS